MGLLEGVIGALVGSTAGQIYSNVKASKEQKKAAQAEQRKAEVVNIRNTRQAIREARLAQGSVVAQGANAGTLGSTGVEGAISSIGAQLDGNLNYLATIAEENTNIFNAQMKSAQYTTAGTIFGAVSSTVSQAYTGAYGQTPGQALGAAIKKKTS